MTPPQIPTEVSMDLIREVAIALLPALTENAPVPEPFDWSFYSEATRERAYQAAQAAASIFETRLSEMRGLLRRFDMLSRTIMIDIGSAHSARGAAASDFMREDDADFRADLRKLFDETKALLAKIDATLKGSNP